MVVSFCSLIPSAEIVKKAFRVSGRGGAFPQSAHRSVSLRSTGGFFIMKEERRQKKNAHNKAWRAAHREYFKDYRKSHQEKIVKWIIKNKERMIEYQKAYATANSKRKSELSRLWYAANHQRRNAKDKYRRNTNPNYRVTINLRNRISGVIRRYNTTRVDHSLKIIGCTISELKAHLESLFKPGMTWENYGLHGWHIDHIRPCASFDLIDPAQQRACFHWTNLQPLWAEENYRKGAKVL